MKCAKLSLHSEYRMVVCLWIQHQVTKRSMRAPPVRGEVHESPSSPRRGSWEPPNPSRGQSPKDCLCESAKCWRSWRNFSFNSQSLESSRVSIIWIIISILEMKWSGNFLFKVEFRDNSGSNGNRNVYSLHDLIQKFVFFTCGQDEGGSPEFLNE